MNIDKKQKSIINLVVLLATLAVNALGMFGYINNMTQQDVSDKYFTPITPTGKTFSIWSVIYGLLLIAFIKELIKDDQDERELVDFITWPFILSNVLNIIWTMAFSYEQMALSTLAIVLFLASLIYISYGLLKLSKNHLLEGLAFGIYTGWLTIATTVNIMALMVKNGFHPFTDNYYAEAVILLILTALFATYINKTIKNSVYVLPIAWAFLGIYNQLKINGNDYKILQVLTIIGLIYMGLLFVLRFWLNKYKVLPAPRKRRR